MVLLTSAIQHCQAGTDSVERLEVKWLSPVSTAGIVERTHLGGSMEATLQWLMGLFNEECVLIILTIAAIIQVTSRSVTVDDSTFTNLIGHLIVIYVTVATDYYWHQVRMHLLLRGRGGGGGGGGVQG